MLSSYQKRERFFVQPLKKIVTDLKGEVNIYSSNWVVELIFLKQKEHIIGYQFPHNSSSVSRICSDKYALFLLLSKEGIPLIEHHFLSPYKDYGSSLKKLKERAVTLLEKYNRAIVIKPNEGSSGSGVKRIFKKKLLTKEVTEFFKKGVPFVINPYVNIKNEYRVILLKTEILLIYGKESQQSWKHNLSEGAKVFLEIEKNVEEKLIEITEKIQKEIDIQFVSIDIVETFKGEFFLLEINSGVMLVNFASLGESYEKKVYSIYKKAIASLIEEEKRF